jgi:hypothetical protein
VSLMSWLRNLLTEKPAPAQSATLNRNDDCWCGSGKKYKKCHLTSDAANQREAKIAAQVAAARRKQTGGIVPGATGGKKGGRRPKPQELKTGADAAKR